MESCCYSAVVRVGCFLETSSRSVLRLQSWVHTKSNVSALFQATFRHFFKLLFCPVVSSLQCIPKATIRHFCTLPPTPRCEGERAWKVVGFSGLQDSGKQAAGQKNCFYRLQRWHEGFCRAAFCLAWARILLLFGRFAWAPPRHFAWHGLESCCCSGVSHGLLHGTTARLRTVWLGHYFRLLHGIWRCGILVSDPASQRGCWPQEMFMRFAWRVLLVFGCFGTGPIRVFRNRTKALFFIVFYGFQRWRERVFWHGCFGTGPKQCLFFMGSKGDVKEFFGTFSGAGFWTGWAWILLGFGCFGSVPNGGRSCHRRCHCSSIHSSIHYMVFAWFFHAFEAACLVMSGIGVGLLHLSCGRQKTTLGSFRGLVFGQVGLESCWGLAVSAPCRTEAGAATEAAIAAPSTAPSTWFLHGFFMLSKLPVWWCQALAGPAGVRVFRNRTKALFFMGSKGDVKESFGMRFAWRVLLVFGCFGTGPIRVFRNRTKALFFIVFYGFQRWRERVFWHGCFGTGPKQCLFFMGSKGDVKEFFGMRLAWRVLASCWCSGVSEPDLLVFGCFGTGPKHCFLWVPKVTRKSFLACVLLGVSC